MAEHKQLMKDKVWVWTDQANGKAYTILAFDDWTLEQPAGFLDQTNLRVVRIPSEKRQQIINAFHKFENNK